MLARRAIDTDHFRSRPRARKSRAGEAKLWPEPPLLRLWQAASRPSLLPPAAILLPQLFRSEASPGFLVRIGGESDLSIERFGQVAGGGANSSRRAPATPVDSAVIDWVLALCRHAVGRRSPVDDAATFAIDGGFHRYTCAIVPMSENGTDIDCLAGLLYGSTTSRRRVARHSTSG